jgi:hypothetical protein
MRRQKSSVLVLFRESLAIALLMALVNFCFAVLAAHAQEPAAAGGWVVLPVEEYRALRARAFPGERPPEPPPVDATLTRVDYDLRINSPGDLATGSASLTVDVIKDGWVRVAVPGGLLVREARLDGKLVSLVPAGAGKSGQLSAVLSHPGRSVLQLEIALPVNASAGEESLALPSTASGVTRASVVLPRQGVEVRLGGGLLADKSESGAESKWLAYGRGNEPLTFTWRRKLEEHRVTLPLRMRGSLRELVGLGEDATSVYAEVDVQIVQGAATEATVQLPEKVAVNQVSGATVSNWKVDDNHRLVVSFLEPVEQGARFVINAETRTPREGQIEVPLLRLLNIERESGGVAVEVLGAGEIKEQKPQGLENTDPSELGEVIAGRQSPSMAAFRFHLGGFATPRSLTLEVARYAQQAVLMANIEEARYHVLASNEGKTLVQARYAVRNNSRNFLKVTMPAGAMVWSATIAGRPVRPGLAPDGSLLLPLEKSRAGDDAPAFAVEVLYLARQTAWTDHGRLQLALPAVDVPISRSGVLLFYSPQFRVTPEPGSFRVQPYERPFSAAFSTAGSATGMFGTPPRPQAKAEEKLLDDFRTKSAGGKTARDLPVAVSFPAFGNSVFLVSELTAEGRAPAIELAYQHEKKEGGK